VYERESGLQQGYPGFQPYYKKYRLFATVDGVLPDSHTGIGRMMLQVASHVRKRELARLIHEENRVTKCREKNKHQAQDTRGRQAEVARETASTQIVDAIAARPDD